MWLILKADAIRNSKLQLLFGTSYTYIYILHTTRQIPASYPFVLRVYLCWICLVCLQSLCSKKLSGKDEKESNQTRKIYLKISFLYPNAKPDIWKAQDRVKFTNGKQGTKNCMLFKAQPDVMDLLLLVKARKRLFDCIIFALCREDDYFGNGFTYQLY